MKGLRVFLVLVQAALVAALGLVLRNRRVPLGVRGEWEWNRLELVPLVLDVVMVLTAIGVYSAFVAVGWRSLGRRAGSRREGGWLTALVLAAVAVQAIVPGAAPYGYGLSKWAIALSNPGSSGYYSVARAQIRDGGQFWKHFPEWARTQEIPRLGAHPPGLFLLSHTALHTMEAHPALARSVLAFMPESVRQGFRQMDQLEPGGVPLADRAALGLIGALTLALCAATVVPLYLLARVRLAAPWAWAAAALWPLMPSAVMFQPTADTAFPLLSTAALALAAWSARGRPALAVVAGLVLALGMMFTLAFLPVGLTVALVLIGGPGVSFRRRCVLILLVGAGFLAVTLAAWLLSGANPFVIWWWNRVNHARFYHNFTRSYGKWVAANVLELAIGLGLPATAWAVAGLATRKAPWLAVAAILTLAFLNFTGLTLSEVGRLWLPWMPVLLMAAGAGMDRLRCGPVSVAATVALLGIQTVLLEGTIQVVYPV